MDGTVIYIAMEYMYIAKTLQSDNIYVHPYCYYLPQSFVVYPVPYWLNEDIPIQITMHIQ